MSNKRYQLQLFWEGRRDGLERLAHELYMFLTALRGVDEYFHDDWLRPADGVWTAATGKEACLEGLNEGVVHWRTGGTERTSYCLELRYQRAIASPIELEIRCGIEPLEGLEPVFVANRLELLLSPTLGEQGGRRQLIEGAFRAAISAFRPVFGYVCTEGFPTPPLAIFSDGTPALGWLSFLSNRYPELPLPLAEPARCHVIGRQGQLIVAHPNLFQRHDKEQLDAIEAVRKRLQAAGVLLPWAQLMAR